MKKSHNRFHFGPFADTVGQTISKSELAEIQAFVKISCCAQNILTNDKH